MSGNKHSLKLRLSLLIFAGAIALSGVSLRAAEGDIEYYSSRPGIESVEPAKEDLSGKNIKLLTGIVDYIAEMRAFYSDSYFYIFARDGEAIYDLWKLLYPQDFESGRVKLVNISTPSIVDPNLKSYLQTIEMIADIERGRHVIALDSGYEGTIVNAINAILKRKGKLYAHLMSARHPDIPSSRISTRPFLASAKRKKDVEDDDYVSEAADMAVLELEGIQHYTETATAYAQTRAGGWDATSVEISSDLKRKALKFIAGVKRFALSADTRKQAARSSELIEKIMSMLQSSKRLKVSEVEQLIRDLKAEELEEVWSDLRESIGKGLITRYNPVRYAELFKIVPEKMQGLDDIWDEDGLDTVLDREQEIFALAEKQAEQAADEAEEVADEVSVAGGQNFNAAELWVADIIRLYLRGLDEVAERKQIFKEFKKNRKEFRRPYGNDAGKIGEKLGEGIRSDVYELGKSRVIKVAYDHEDMTALEGEKLVFDFLKANAAKYPFRLLEILEEGPKGIYLIKPKVEKDTIGKYILRANGELNREQMRSLEQVYKIAYRLAVDTGISLDIKSDNLVWTKKGWVILDLGARTMSHPYFFTLESKTFARYLEIWDSDSGSRTGVMDVEDYIKQSQRQCEAAVINGYRVLKADD